MGSGVRVDEKTFQNDFLISCQQANFYVKKIPDAVRSPQSRFIPQKPFDLFALNNGKFYALELKYLKVKKLKTKYSSFPLSKIRDVQLDNLRQIEQHGGKGFIVICTDISAVDTPEDAVAFFIPISEIKTNKGVMEFEELKKFRFITRRIRAEKELKHRWNVDNLFEIMEE